MTTDHPTPRTDGLSGPLAVVAQQVDVVEEWLNDPSGPAPALPVLPDGPDDEQTVSRAALQDLAERTTRCIERLSETRDDVRRELDDSGPRRAAARTYLGQGAANPA